jgi:Flp pilus assembly protein TadG
MTSPGTRLLARTRRHLRSLMAPRRRRLLGAAHGLLCRFGREQSGSSYVAIAGLTLPALLGMAGLGTEVGLDYYTHQHMQSAADSSALSAATAYYVQGSSTGLATQAKAASAAYGFVAGSNGVTVTVNQPPTSGSHTTTSSAVEVIIQQPQTRLFSSLFTSAPLTISTRSVAIANGGLGCVLSLDALASGAATVKGTAAVTLNGCSLMDNSASSTALNVNGSSTLSALSVSVVGDISGTSSNITTTQGVTTGAAAAADPYANASYPSFSRCDHHNFSSKRTEPMDPGVYCGGISLNAGADVTLNPGIYYLDQGSLSVNGGAAMTGTGVTLVFTSSTGNNYATATINGGATVNLTAPLPSSGLSTAGIAMFADRNMPVGTAFKFEGGASQDIKGALYFPKGAVSFAGGAGTGTSCTQLIGDTLTFTGNSNFAVNCKGYGTKPLGSGIAKLVE